MTDARLAGIEAEVLASATSSVRLAGAVVEVLFDTVHIPVSDARVAGAVVEALVTADVDARLGGMVVETLVQQVTGARLGATVLEVLATAPPELPGDFDGEQPAVQGPFLYAVPMTPGAVEGDPSGYLEPIVQLAAGSNGHQLTGSSLPGQVLESVGIAVASGELTFKQPEKWSADPVITPWGDKALWTDIGQFAIWAINEEPADLAELLEDGGELMRCVARPVRGALTDPGVSVEFDQLIAGGSEPAVWTDWPKVTYAHSPADDPYTLGTLLSQAFPDALASPAKVAGDWAQLMTTPGLEAKGMTVGEVLRAYVEPLGGAVVADIVTGRFHLFTLEDLTAGEAVETVQVADKLEDIKWVTDASEIRTAVDLAFRVVRWQKVKTAKELWKADSPLALPAVQTVQVSDAVGYATAATEVHPNLDGTGTAIASATQAVETVPGTWDLSFDDKGTGTNINWSVDSQGEPSARLITNWPGTWLDRTLRVGSADTDTDVLHVDGGPAIQNAGTAAQVASFLQALVSTRRWAIDRVKVVPDLRRRVADVIKLVYDDVDNDIHLACRAVITGIDLDWDATGIGQQLSLAVCPSTLGDIDDYLDAHGVGPTLGDVDDFLDAAGVGPTLGDFDDYPWESA